jgi:hypothetical protein
MVSAHGTSCKVDDCVHLSIACGGLGERGRDNTCNVQESCLSCPESTSLQDRRWGVFQ